MLAISKIELERHITKASLYDFVRRFWSTLIPETFVDNWHIKYICDELQVIAERVFQRNPKEYDLVVNIPPGSSKSTVFSEMFPAWAWTRDPTFRMICSSYAMTLSLDLAERTRRIIQSDKYLTLFPEIKLVNESVGDLQNSLGGERVATATGAKNITGRHAHCLAGDSLVMTDKGLLRIDSIDLIKASCKVLSYGKTRSEGRLSFQRCQAVKRSQGGRLYRITTTAGRVVEATGEHPFFSAGRWKNAEVLSPGDSLLLLLQEENGKALKRFEGHSRWEEGRPVLLAGVCTPKRGRMLWPRPHQRKTDKGTAKGQEPKVSNVRGTNRQVYSEVLRQVPPVRPFPCPSLDFETVRDMQHRFQNKEQDQSFLWQGVCEQRAWDPGGESRQSEMEGRQIGEATWGLLSRVLSTKAKRIEARSNGVCCVQTNGQDIACSSHRRGSSQQRSGEFGNALLYLPQTVARGEGFEAVEDTVALVEQLCQEPTDVWDIQVEGNHNFFANGILVHNCFMVDDAMNPNEMSSEAETKSAIRFYDETAPSRTVNSALTPFLFIGQRLGINDVYGHFLAKSKIIPIRHICIPAELHDNVRPRALKNKYVDGLFDPVRLPQTELNKKRDGGMTIFAFSGQYNQDPILAGGSLFLTENIKIVESPPPPNTVRRTIRSWDKSSSYARGCYTVGVLMAKDRDGFFWILDVVRGQWEATQREQIIRHTAERDGKGVEIVIEEEAGGAGKESAQFTTRNLAGFRIRTYRPTRAKEQRAYGFSAQVNAGNVRMLRAPWNGPLVNELQLFPHDGKFADQVDSCSQAFIALTKVMVIGGIGALAKGQGGGLRKLSPLVVR